LFGSAFWGLYNQSATQFGRRCNRAVGGYACLVDDVLGARSLLLKTKTAFAFYELCAKGAISKLLLLLCISEAGDKST
jgi:hypothetical protein